MITKLENYKWAKANAFIHVCNLNWGKKGKGCGDAYKWVNTGENERGSDR